MVALAGGAGATFADGSEHFFEAGADIEESGAERAEEAFVAGCGEEINAVGLHVDGDMPGGLGDVHDERDAVTAGDLADCSDGLDGAGDVAGVGDGDEAGVGPDGAGDVIGIDEAVCGIDGDSCLFDQAGIYKRIERAKDGVVIDLGAYGVSFVGGVDETFDREIESIRAIEGEDEMLASLAVEQFVKATAAFAEEFTGLDGFAIGSAAGAGADLGGVADHGFGYLRRLGETGGGVIEIKAARRRGGF